VLSERLLGLYSLPFGGEDFKGAFLKNQYKNVMEKCENNQKGKCGGNLDYDVKKNQNKCIFSHIMIQKLVPARAVPHNDHHA